MTDSEMRDLIDSMRNALDLLEMTERDATKGVALCPQDRRVWAAAKRFVMAWRTISNEVVEAQIAKVSKK